MQPHATGTQLGLVHRLSPYQSQPGVFPKAFETCIMAAGSQHPFCWPTRRPRNPIIQDDCSPTRMQVREEIASHCNLPCVGDPESALHLIGLRIIIFTTSARRQDPFFRPRIRVSNMSLHVWRVSCSKI